MENSVVYIAQTPQSLPQAGGFMYFFGWPCMIKDQGPPDQNKLEML